MSRALATVAPAALDRDEFEENWQRRFWDKVLFDDTCWECDGGATPKGYGVCCTKAMTGRPKQQYAHRLSWEMARGPIPDGLKVLHQCDNPRCVRPAHLFLGTQVDNMRDCAAKGRHRPNARLTPEQVEQIRAKHAAGGVTFFDLGREFGIAYQHAHAIVRGNKWSRTI